MTVRILVPLLSAALAACVPTMEMRDGPERDRLIQVVNGFCDAERSGDPSDSAALFAEPVRRMIESLPATDETGGARYLTSVDPRLECASGRSWYLGGSRMFAEVRLRGRSDRLDLWSGDSWRIRNVLYGRPRLVGPPKAKSLQDSLTREFASASKHLAPQKPIAGRYSQSAATGGRNPPCENLPPVGEVEFGENGRFSVTFHPFESYRDYWGRYRLDERGVLTLEIEGGNGGFKSWAGRILKGTAGRDHRGRLVLDGFALGQDHDWMPGPDGRMTQAPCRYTF